MRRGPADGRVGVFLYLEGFVVLDGFACKTRVLRLQLTCDQASLIFSVEVQRYA